MDIQKRITFVEHSESKIGQTWTPADHVKLVRHLEAVDQLAASAVALRMGSLKSNELLRQLMREGS